MSVDACTLTRTLGQAAREVYVGKTLFIQLREFVPWTRFKLHPMGFRAAVELPTLLDLRGAIPAFIRASDGKLHDVNVLDALVIEAAQAALRRHRQCQRGCLPHSTPSTSARSSLPAKSVR